MTTMPAQVLLLASMCAVLALLLASRKPPREGSAGRSEGDAADDATAALLAPEPADPPTPGQLFGPIEPVRLVDIFGAESSYAYADSVDEAFEEPGDAAFEDANFEDAAFEDAAFEDAAEFHDAFLELENELRDDIPGPLEETPASPRPSPQPEPQPEEPQPGEPQPGEPQPQEPQPGEPERPLRSAFETFAAFQRPPVPEPPAPPPPPVPPLSLSRVSALPLPAGVTGVSLEPRPRKRGVMARGVSRMAARVARCFGAGARLRE